MRILLTCLAVLMVVAMTAAAVGPLLIDWSAQRGVLAAELTRRVGEPVEIAGPIDLRLLPTPYITVAQVRVGATGGVPWLDCESMRFELSLGALFGGRVHLTEATLRRPMVRVGPAASAAWASRPAELEARARQFEFDRITVEHGGLSIERQGGPPIVFDDVALDASAKSLLGPFRGAGSFATPDRRRTRFQFVSAEASVGGLPVKGEIDRVAEGPRADFDGLIGWPSGELDPFYKGAVTIAGMLPESATGAAAWPWRAKAALRLDGQGARFDNLSLRVGPDARAVEAMGLANLAFGEDLAVTASLSAKQVNFDSLLRGENQDAASPKRFLAALSTLTDFAWRNAAPRARLSLTLSTPQAFLGARTVNDTEVSLTGEPGAPVVGELRTGLPGDSRVHLKGSWELGPGAKFSGAAQGEIGDFAALRQWVALDQPDLSEKLASLEQALPPGVAKGSGLVEISPSGVSVRDLKLSIERSNFAGAMAFTRGTDDRRGRLFLDLSSDGLDIEVAPNLEAASAWLGDLDLKLSLTASKLRVARLGRASMEGGSLTLTATKEGARISLDDLSLQGLGGATIEAQGQSSPAGRWVRLKVNAAQLHDFAALVAKVAPGRLSDLLLERADSLSPAKATFEARRDGPPLTGAFPLDFIRTDGEAGASRFSVRLSRAPAPVDAMLADISLDAADGGVLLRQFGAKVPAKAVGRAHLGLNASGLWESGFDATASASLAGADLSWRGRLSPMPASPGDPVAVGAATLKSSNLLDAFAALGLGAAEIAAPVDLSANLIVRVDGFELGALSGAAAGAKLSGQMAWRQPTPDVSSFNPDIALARSLSGEPAPTRPALTGELTLDKATAAGFLAIPLGSASSPRSGSAWPEARFAAPLLSPPPTDLQLRIGSFDVWPGFSARNVTTRLRMGSAGFDLGDLALDLAGGKATGQLTLRRDGALATATGQLRLDSIAVDRAALRGRLNGRLDFAGAGTSAAALIGGLAGQASVQVTNLAVPRLDPGALTRVLAKAEAPDALIDETNLSHAFGAELDRRALNAPDVTTPASLSSGVLRIGPVDLPPDLGGGSLAAEYDLRSFALDLRSVLRESRVSKFWSGAPPSASVVVHGALDAPSRRIDVSSLAAGLAGETIARESERIAVLEADMRERAAFNRGLKARRFLDRREGEIAAYEAEQARAKDEAERKRIAAEFAQSYQDYVRSRQPGIEDLLKAIPLAPPLAAPDVAHGAHATPPADPAASGLY